MSAQTDYHVLTAPDLRKLCLHVKEYLKDPADMDGYKGGRWQALGGATYSPENAQWSQTMVYVEEAA